MARLPTLNTLQPGCSVVSAGCWVAQSFRSLCHLPSNSGDQIAKVERLRLSSCARVCDAASLSSPPLFPIPVLFAPSLGVRRDVTMKKEEENTPPSPSPVYFYFYTQCRLLAVFPVTSRALGLVLLPLRNLVVFTVTPSLTGFLSPAMSFSAVND